MTLEITRFRHYWVLLALFMTVSVHASPAATPEAQAYLEKYGIDFPFSKEQEIIGLYTKLLRNTHHENGALQVARAQSYGPDPRNRLDVHYLKGAERSAHPILLFFHGGGFVGGDIKISDEIYDNLGHYFARAGIVAVNVRYRLAPAHQWPSGIEDVAAAVKWAREHGPQFGGDPRHIFVMGHSAGAAHVAGYFFGLKPEEQPVAGAILMSGAYKAPQEDNPYYGKDLSRRSEQSPVSHLAMSGSLPTMVVFSEYDPLELQSQALDLIQLLCIRDKKCPTVKQVMGHNHMSMVFHIDTADDSVGSDIVGFIQRYSAVEK